MNKIITLYFSTFLVLSPISHSLVTKALIYTNETISVRRLFQKGTHQAEQGYLTDTTSAMPQQFINKERKILLAFNHRVPL